MYVWKEKGEYRAIKLLEKKNKIATIIIHFNTSLIAYTSGQQIFPGPNAAN